MRKKCTNCGFINFATAEECKKCEAVLPAPDEFHNTNPVGSPYANAARAPKQSFPVDTLVFVGVVIVVIAVALSAIAGLKLRSSLLSLRKVNWTEYHPAGLDMTVMMPNEPTKLEPVTTSLAIGSMTNQSFLSNVAGQGQAVFSVINYEDAGDSIKPELESRILDAELTEFTRRTSSIPFSKNYVPFKGIVALDFVIQPPSARGAKLYGRMFMVKNRLYFFAITAKEGSELFEGKEKFLNPDVRTM